jgi:hypothetical protein
VFDGYGVNRVSSVTKLFLMGSRIKKLVLIAQWKKPSRTLRFASHDGERESIVWVEKRKAKHVYDIENCDNMPPDTDYYNNLL